MTTDLVTGAFSYTGRHVARRLLAGGRAVRTLTNHGLGSDRLEPAVSVYPLDFDKPGVMDEAMRGVDTVYNTYWVRFPRGRITYERAVENSRRLVDAAESAGVRRFVHVSIANATEDSPLPYYRGKAMVEAYLRASSLSYAIVRPTVIYGGGDVLINNIAWFLRHLPVFAIPGSSASRIQPVYVEDHADLMVRLGGATETVAVDSVGPDAYTFADLVGLIHREVGSRSLVLRPPGRLVLAGLRAVGPLVRDVVLTSDELKGLQQDLLVSSGPATCPTRFAEWLRYNADSLGRTYASELGRHFRSYS